VKQLIPVTAQLPTLIRRAGDRAQTRFWEFFISNIHTAHARRTWALFAAAFARQNER
jgi:hypothetical protein